MCKDSLVEMSLKIGCHLLNPAPISFRMNFPKLEKLNIEEYKEELDHLLELSALKNLTLSISCYPRYENKSIVELEGFEDHMDESNIWTLMPKLRRLKMGGYCCEGNRLETKVYNRCPQTQKISIVNAAYIQ